MTERIIDGLVVSIFSDSGPVPILNLSQLDEVTTQKLSIVGITILSMGLNTVEMRDKREFILLGPIPVPDSLDSSVLCIFFTVRPDLGTQDPRIIEFGRVCNLWILFKTEDREKIFSQYKVIEKTATEKLVTIINESELKEDLFKDLLNTLQKQQFRIESDQISEKDLPKQITSELLNYGFFTINEEEATIPVRDLNNLSNLSNLIQIDMKNKNILVLKLKPDISQRKMFIVGRAASQLNLEMLKSEFNVQKINDKIEVDFQLNKIQNLIRKIS